MKTQMKANLLLLLVAAIWGAAFVAQSSGMDHVGPFTFMFCRFIIGGLVLLPFIWLEDKKGGKKMPLAKKDLVLCGILCGVILFLGNGTQQLGLQFTSAGKSGFITTLYVVLVPVFSIFLGKKPSLKLWISVVLACTALYLLCMDGDLSVGKGEILTLIGAFMFVGHILVIDHFAGRVSAIKMSCIQFFICALCAGVGMVLTETPTLDGILDCWLPIAYAGVLSTGVAFTLQAVAQSKTNPTTASIIMSLESCFAVLFGWVLLNEALNAKELIGCAVMFVAIILAQLPQKMKRSI